VREKPHLPGFGDEDAGNVTFPCVFILFSALERTAENALHDFSSL